MPTELSLSQPAMAGPSVVSVTYIGGGGTQAGDSRMPGVETLPSVASSHLQLMTGTHGRRELHVHEPLETPALMVSQEEAMEEQQGVEEEKSEQFITLAELTANRMSEAGICIG